MGSLLTQEEVLRRAEEVHGDRWLYDRFSYKDMLSKALIGCEEHGYFEQTPAKHIHQKQGCPKCGKKMAGKSKQKTQVARRMVGVNQPAEFKIIPLSPSGFTEVSNEDFPYLSSMCWKNNNGYAMSTKYGSMHRLIMNPAPNEFVDHIDRNPLNNRRENLRVVSPQENTFNSRPYGKSSKYKGVCWNKHVNKWVVQIVYSGERVCKKYFNDEVEAAEYYDQEIVKYHGDKAYLNFPNSKYQQLNDR